MIASWSSSIAPMTACSASSENGGRRSLYGSTRRLGAIEYSTGELDIFPGGTLPGRVPQERGGMIRRDERDPVVAMHLASQLRDPELRAEERLRCEVAHRENHFRPKELELPHEIRRTRFDLVLFRVAIPRRAVLQDVADEYVLAAQANGREDLGKELSRRTDERESGRVLLASRRLADDDEIGVRVALARNGILRAAVQRTTRASGHGAREIVERREMIHRTAEQLRRRLTHDEPRRRVDSVDGPAIRLLR